MTGKPSTNHDQDHSDVIVVGAGPTGLLLAGDLAEAGLNVTLLERRPPGISNLTRALVVHARTLEQLDARGLADELIATGNPVTRLALFGMADIHPTRLPSRFPYVLVTPQFEVERVLERRAREAGVTFAYGNEVTGLTQGTDGVTLQVRRHPENGAESTGAESNEADSAANGTPATAYHPTYRATYVVGTDGVHSGVREALGLPFPGQSVLRSIVLADVRLKRQPEDPFLLRGQPNAFAVLAGYGDGWHRVIGWNRARQLPDSAPVDLDEVREITRLAVGDDYGMYEARWVSRFHSDERQVPAYRTGRVFLAGDAAHSHSPAGGMGMNTGLQDAANLSWKLISVLRGHAPDQLLDTYHDERHPVGKMVLRISGAIIRTALLHTPPQRALRALAARIVDTVRPVSDLALRRISGIGIAYPAPRGAHPLTGKRAPDVHLADGSRLYEALRGSRFVLITPAYATPDLTGLDTTRLVRATWRGDRRTSLLVRPDGYIAWACDTLDPTTRDRALRDTYRHWTAPATPAAAPAPAPDPAY